MEEGLLLLLLGLAALIWQSHMRARERAQLAGRHACEQRAYQLLDDTVAIEGLRLRRDEHGRLRLERRYGFEFSDGGDTRRRGSIVLLGDRVELVWLEGGEWQLP
ncbi:MAG TPA: DUF3301 domain-containing protein [Candidatus Competibacteraceae bacterium]|nr:DUF3301 domain-containing protein [Candidatus Competibacteraceae bacterium]